jgi:hypothetical protein
VDVPYFIQSSRPFKKIQRGIISNRVNLISGVLGKKIEPVIYDSKVSPTEGSTFSSSPQGASEVPEEQQIDTPIGIHSVINNCALLSLPSE